MNQDGQIKDRGVTLNSLLEEHRSLNMRMLLAIQLRDQETQRELQAGLDDVELRIQRLLSGGLCRLDSSQ